MLQMEILLAYKTRRREETLKSKCSKLINYLKKQSYNIIEYNFHYILYCLFLILFNITIINLLI